MLRSRNFWIGFLAGYLLLAFVPSANVLAALKNK